MKREFLKELGLESDVVDKIMVEHGKTLSKEKTKLESKIVELESQITADKDTITSLTTKVKDFEKIDVEKLEKETQEWKAKYENLEMDNHINSFFKDYKFTSKLAEKATIDEFKKQNFEIKDGEFKGAKDFMNKFMQDNKEAFVVEDSNKEDEDINVKSNFYSYSPSSGSSNNNNDSFENQLNSILNIK